MVRAKTLKQLLGLLHQLRLKIREVEEISVRLNFSVLVNFQDTDAVQEEDISGLGLKTYPPFDGSFLTADRDVSRLESHFIQERGKRLLISKDGLCPCIGVFPTASSIVPSGAKQSVVP